MSDRLKPLIKTLGLKARGSGSLGWWALPSTKKPRLLIPIDSTHWKSATQLINTRSRRVILKGLLFLFKITRRASDFTCDSMPTCLRQGKTLNGITHFVVNISTPNRFSKYTLSLLNRDGSPEAYAKISEKPGAAIAIEGEAKALEFLAFTKIPPKHFPQLIHFEQNFSIQSASSPGGYGNLAGKCGRIAKLLFSQESQEVEWEISQTREVILQTAKRLAAMGASRQSSEITYFAGRLGSLWGESRFLEGMTHGDMVSWNSEDTVDGFIYDWEWMAVRSELHDLFHYLWFPEIQKQQPVKLAKLWNILDSDTGKAFASGYGFQGAEIPLRRGGSYLLRSYSFYVEQCLLNQEEPENYPFTENLKCLLGEALDCSDRDPRK